MTLKSATQPAERVTKSVEGILDVERKTRGYAHEQRITAEGILIGIQDVEFTFNSTALFVNKSEKIRGVDLKIQNQRGIGVVKLPKEIPHLKYRQDMLNQRVKYSLNTWSSRTEGTSEDYCLEILSGPLNGEKLIEQVFV